MSEDEIFATWAGVAAGLLGWVRWYLPIMRLRVLGARSNARALLAYAPLFSFALLFLVLRTAASWDVRDSTPYLFMYMAIGAGWTGIATMFLSWLGISPRSDAIERDNAAAGCALAGAVVAIMLCYAGGNIGDGPGWWVVIVCAKLATLGLALLWYLLERFASVAEQVTVERDVAAGMRLGGFLLACAIVLGRAVAGDWESAEATLTDFALGAWPALVLLALAVMMERRLRATVEQPAPDTTTHGLMPALLYPALAVTWVLLFGPVT